MQLQIFEFQNPVRVILNICKRLIHCLLSNARNEYRLMGRSFSPVVHYRHLCGCSIYLGEENPVEDTNLCLIDNRTRSRRIWGRDDWEEIKKIGSAAYSKRRLTFLQLGQIRSLVSGDLCWLAGTAVEGSFLRLQAQEKGRINCRLERKRTRRKWKMGHGLCWRMLSTILCCSNAWDE